jgi:hypothetical protein
MDLREAGGVIVIGSEPVFSQIPFGVFMNSLT